MLTQLARLSVEADGRYATTDELQFLQGYLQSLDPRMSAYKKISAAAEEIISQTEAKMRSLDPTIFTSASGDFSERWKKDITRQLRYIAITLLLADYEHLRQGFLIWFKSIVSAYKFDRTCKMTFQVMPEVIKHYLAPEEEAWFSQILGIHRATLT